MVTLFCRCVAGCGKKSGFPTGRERKQHAVCMVRKRIIQLFRKRKIDARLCLTSLSSRLHTCCKNILIIVINPTRDKSSTVSHTYNTYTHSSLTKITSAAHTLSVKNRTLSPPYREREKNHRGSRKNRSKSQPLLCG